MKIYAMKAGLLTMLALGLAACTDVANDTADPLLARIEALETQHAAAALRIEANTALATDRGDALQPVEVDEALLAQLSEHAARLAEVEAFAQTGATRDWVMARGFASYDALDGLGAYAETVANLGIARSERLNAHQLQLNAHQLRLDALDATGQQANLRLGQLESAQNNAAPAFGPQLAGLAAAIGPDGALQIQLDAFGERLDGADAQLEDVDTQLETLDGLLTALPLAEMGDAITALEETLATARTGLAVVERLASGANLSANTANNALNAQRQTITALRSMLVEYIAEHRDEYVVLDAAMRGATQSIGVHQENLANLGQALDAQQQDLGAQQQRIEDHGVALGGLNQSSAQVFGRIDTLGRDATALAETVESNDARVRRLSTNQTQARLALEEDMTSHLSDLDRTKMPRVRSLEDFATYLDVDRAQSLITLSGANLRITHGDLINPTRKNGVGNLLLGYPVVVGDRDLTGSHNLVIGPNHSYGAMAGLVTGVNNAITSDYSVVLGGRRNLAEGYQSAIIGGTGNTALGFQSAVVAGENNTATGQASAVFGGQANTASGHRTTITGGQGSIAVGEHSTISGGLDNVTLGEHAWVGGGRLNNASGARSAVLGGAENEANGAEQVRVGQ